MSLLSDDQAARLHDLVSSASLIGLVHRGELAGVDAVRWIKALLADRAERVALAQRVSWQIERARRYLGSGAHDRDLEQLLTSAKKTADAPWTNQIACEKCGAPAIRVATDGARHALVVTHPDGRRCTLDHRGG